MLLRGEELLELPGLASFWRASWPRRQRGVGGGRCGFGVGLLSGKGRGARGGGVGGAGAVRPFVSSGPHFFVLESSIVRALYETGGVQALSVHHVSGLTV